MRTAEELAGPNLCVQLDVLAGFCRQLSNGVQAVLIHRRNGPTMAKNGGRIGRSNETQMRQAHVDEGESSQHCVDHELRQHRWWYVRDSPVSCISDKMVDLLTCGEFHAL